MHLSTGEIPDPFLAAVRRGRPDADVVVLPPDVAPPAPGEHGDHGGGAAALAASLDLVATWSQRLWSVAAPDTDVVAPVRPVWGRSPDVVHAEARLLTHRADGRAVLDRLLRELGAAGWAVARPPGGLPRVEGRLAPPGLVVRATYAPEHDVVVWAVRGPDVGLGVEGARVVVRAGRPGTEGGA